MRFKINLFWKVAIFLIVLFSLTLSMFQIVGLNVFTTANGGFYTICYNIFLNTFFGGVLTDFNSVICHLLGFYLMIILITLTLALILFICIIIINTIKGAIKWK